MFSRYIWDSCSFLKRPKRSGSRGEGSGEEGLREEDGGKNCYQSLIYGGGAEGEEKNH